MPRMIASSGTRRRASSHLRCRRRRPRGACRRPLRHEFARRLIAQSASEAELHAIGRGFAPGLPLYLIVFVLAFFSPVAAVILALALTAFYLPSAALFAGG